jgi:hypothetical protein
MSQEQKQALNGILKRVYASELTPLQAVLETDRAIGGITGVDLRVGLTISNHRDKISVQREGLGKKETQKLEEYATLAYWKAQRNGSLRPGEVHIGRGLSSKHYAGNFRAYQNELLANYAN